MGKAKRKPRPSVPYWYSAGIDECWCCKHKNNCNQCKVNRSFLKEYGEKKIKGRKAGAKRRKFDEI